MGFYKNDNNLLIWSADRVINDNFQLLLADKDTYTYPVEGWIWADTDLIARQILECYGEQPFPSWTVNLTTAQYEPPTPMPKDGKFYTWSEDNLNWIEMAND